MKIHCTHCGQRLEIDDEYAGHKVPCPICQQEFRVPVVAEPVSSAGSRYNVWFITGLVVVVGLVSVLITLAVVRDKKPSVESPTAQQIQTLPSSNKPQTMFAESRAKTEIDPKLVFRTNNLGELSFDTGVIRGTIQKDGRGEALVLRFNEGDIRIDKNHGLFAPYRFLTSEKR